MNSIYCESGICYSIVKDAISKLHNLHSGLDVGLGGQKERELFGPRREHNHACSIPCLILTLDSCFNWILAACECVCSKFTTCCPRGGGPLLRVVERPDADTHENVVPQFAHAEVHPRTSVSHARCRMARRG